MEEKRMKTSKHSYGYIAPTQAVNCIKRGDVLVYYCGLIMHDRWDVRGGGFLVAAMQQLTYDLYARHRAELVQRRVCTQWYVAGTVRDVAAYEYIVIGV